MTPNWSQEAEGCSALNNWAADDKIMEETIFEAEMGPTTEAEVAT